MDDSNAVSRRWLGVGYSAESDARTAGAAALRHSDPRLLMHDTETTIAKLLALKELDVRIAIDDFGTGYSSLQYLQRFPIDVLKIPRPFVDELVDDDSPGVLASVILDLCHRLGRGTVAEGIETEKQAQRLRELGCPWGQGFLFAKPMRIGDLMAFTASLPAPAAVTQ